MNYKTAVVTGGSSGLGEAIVCRLAEEGLSVAIGCRATTVMPASPRSSSAA
ncbi:MAG: SDR family NAD(P)-dependent oxidoreductase [Actinobacteria bacterium]|nr:SDR family NAD(P)-dependent oxidoreductase [Actinomycetota bacterium]